MTVFIPAQRALVFLENPSDWVLWFRTIHRYAYIHNVWKYCDPDGTEVIPADEPMPDKAAQEALGAFWYEIWRDTKNDKAELRNSVAMVYQRILDTIERAFLSWCDPDATCRETLITLRTAAGYTSAVIRTNLTKELNRLEKGRGKKTNP